MWKSWDKSKVVLLVVLVLLLTSNVFLIIQNLQLKDAVERSKRFVTEEGYKFGRLKMRDADGKESEVDFDDHHVKTVLLVFSPTCEYCIQQYPYWKDLINEVSSRNFRVLAITAEPDSQKISEHLEKYQMKGVTVGSVSTDELSKARLLYTPMTVLVSSEGIVETVWPGLWTRKFALVN